MTGLHLSQYCIDSELGRGGMGVVYLATDTKLNRKVALKVLPAAALGSDDDRARFFREAQAAAQLSHPNVCHVYQVDEAIPLNEDGEQVTGHGDRRLFIAMEYIEGDTVREVVEKGPLKLADAVNIAGQVAEALKEAHAKDIVHRDIKSANVMLTASGVAKVLDFGLAKTNQSTMLTRMGSTLGTVAYMSPEQARGQEVDGRTDLYSLGTMLYEMVAGKLPFAGDYEQAVLYGIMNEPPEPLTTLRTGVPMQLEWLVNKLLAKEVEYRYQSAADVLVDLKSLDLSGSGHSRRSVASVAGSQPATPSRALPMWAWGTIATALIVGALGAWWIKPAPAADIGPTMRTLFDMGSETIGVAGVALSPSGRLLAVSWNFEEIRVYNLETGEEWAIPESARTVELSFNDDETWLLLQRPRRIDRVQVRGSSPVEFESTVSGGPNPKWTPDGAVLFEDEGTLWVKPLTGGERRPFAIPDSTEYYDAPHLTTDGRYVVAEFGTQGSGGTSQFAVFRYRDASLLGMLDVQGDFPRYVETGHLIYQTGEGIMGIASDLDPPRLLGAPVPLFKGQRMNSLSLSESGHLVLGDRPRGAEGQQERDFKILRWDGSLEETEAPPGAYDWFRVAPTPPLRVAVEQAAEDGGESLWITNLESGTTNRLTYGDVGDNPWWHPSGDSILYVDRSGEETLLVLRAADGSGVPRTLLESTVNLSFPSASRDFSQVAFGRNDGDWDLWILDIASGEAAPIIQEEGSQFQAALSPDGRFLAFEGNHVGDEWRVYMEAVEGSGRWDLSRGPGFDVAWSPDGKSVYYEAPGTTFRVDIATEDGRVAVSNPQALPFAPDINMDALPDGTGLVILQQVGEATESSEESTARFIRVRSNWKKELARLIPRGD